MDEKDNLTKELSKLMAATLNSVAESTGVPKQLIGGTGIDGLYKSFIKTFAGMLGATSSLFEAEAKQQKKSATENETDELAQEATEWGYNHVFEEYSKYDFQLMGRTYSYQKLSDEVYQFIRDRIINDYDFSEDGWEIMYSALADIVYQRVDFNRVWEAIDEVMNAPVTFEEKLAEVGMSVHDFL